MRKKTKVGISLAWSVFNDTSGTLLIVSEGLVPSDRAAQMLLGVSVSSSSE